MGLFRATISILSGISMLAGLAVAQNAPRPAEQAFKNIKVLTGVPEDLVQPTMWFFTAALGVRCRFCHEDDNSKRELDTRPQKAVARRMIEMTMALNKNSFGGRPVVTCNTCHRGNSHPVGSPAVGIETSGAGEPAEGARAAAAPPVPTLDQVLAKYDAAMGGAGAAQKISSVAAKATVVDTNFNGEHKTMQADILAKVPGSRMVTTHEGTEGDAISTLNGDTGWVVTLENKNPRNMRPGDLEAAKLEDPLYVAGRVKDVITDMRVQTRPEKVEGRDAIVVAGTSRGSTALRLYFDRESGLLSRLVYDTKTLFGPYFTRIDYSDYRNAEGMQLPYHWKISRVRGEVSDYQATELKVNAPVDAARFAKPARADTK